MLYYALVFLVIALVAGILGFGVLAGTAMWVARVLFVIFIILLILSFLMGRRTAP